MIKRDLVIVGGGPAGLAAAIEARKNGVKSILVLERDRELGGILMQCIHTGFGLHTFKAELSGPEFAERLIEELETMGIEYRLDTMVTEVCSDRTVKAVSAEFGLITVRAGAVVLAMGCRERTRGAIGIPGTRPSGVLNAGTAQRYINMEGYMVGKRVVILGSGDIGLIMARRLALEGSEVLAVIEAKPFSSGLKRNIVQCLEDFDIPLLLSHSVSNIIGRDRIEAVEISEVDESMAPIPGTGRIIECDTLLLSVGLIPENELSRGAGVEIDPTTGGPIVSESMETSIPGIFAGGNVVHVHDIVDFAVEESRKAGMGAAKLVTGKATSEGAVLQIVRGDGIGSAVPQIVRRANVSDPVTFYLRVESIYKDADIVVSFDDHIVMKKYRKLMVPGEMESVELSRDTLPAASGQLKFSVISRGDENGGM